MNLYFEKNKEVSESKMSEKEIAQSFYTNFRLVSYRSLQHLDQKQIQELEEVRDNVFNSHKELIPDIVFVYFLEQFSKP